MRVLITRPEADATELAAELVRRGHVVLSDPLLRIDWLQGAPADTTNVQAVVLTSANGARAAGARIADKSIRVFAVGPTTARAAAEAGFADVSASTGSGVPDLVSHVMAHAKPGAGALLHVTGRHTAGDFAGTLSDRGFSVRTLQAYDAVAASELSAQTRAGLADGSIDAAMFFSPRTAGTFSALVRKGNLAVGCTRLAALAISQNVADALQPLIFRKVLVAETTGTASMLELLVAV